uniref:Uncharacterized protein n=1 Tax=Tremella fuciformis TaxID=64657 RepID=A0A2H4QCA2_9TREE|nr:hypothetical protein [Tremella fuciformis]ATX62039.1 hypothetical protein [Tremella fuciformis]
MQVLDTSYNMQVYSNYGGGPNKGRTGVIRDEMFRQNASIQHLGREYSDYTNSLHRDNQLGKVLSDRTRRKMIESAGGVQVYYYSYVTESFGVFNTKVIARATLGVSLRTIGRWAESRKPKSTKVDAFKKVILGYTRITKQEVRK